MIQNQHDSCTQETLLHVFNPLVESSVAGANFFFLLLVIIYLYEN